MPNHNLKSQENEQRTGRFPYCIQKSKTVEIKSSIHEIIFNNFRTGYWEAPVTKVICFVKLMPE